MKKLPFLLAACLLLCTLAFHASGQGVVLMPDSTNNRLVAFDPMNGSVLTSNMFALTAGATPLHALQVGSEIWVSEQIGDRVARYDFSGNFLGAITGLDNVRGMALIGSTVYVTNAGTNNGAPGNAVVMYNTSGVLLGSFPTAGLAPSPFSVLAHQGGILVGSSSQNDDIHRFTLTGTSVGTFHNTASLNFVEQLAFASNGSILAAGFSSNNIAFLDPNNGNLLSSFAAAGARGVYQLGNGNILWTSGAGASIYDVTTQTSSLIYAGSGRFLQFAVIPEPSTLAIFGVGVLVLGAVTRRSRKP